MQRFAVFTRRKALRQSQRAFYTGNRERFLYHLKIMITVTRRAFIVVSAALALLPLTGRAELPMAQEKVQPLGQGLQIPEDTLKTVDGKNFALRAETEAQPTVIIFYRGGWCPYCNAHLADVQKAEKDLLALGYRIAAVCPLRAADSPRHHG